MNQLIAAYKKTKYKISELKLILEIEKANVDLDQLLSKYNVTEWAFITAYNPYSKILNKIENIERHNELIELTGSYITFEGYGDGEDPSWEPEISLLIIGINKSDAKSLGNKFEQNAIVYGTSISKPELLILNDSLI